MKRVLDATWFVSMPLTSLFVVFFQDELSFHHFHRYDNGYLLCFHDNVELKKAESSLKKAGLFCQCFRCNNW